MAWRRIVLGKRDATVGDAYRSVADLLGLGQGVVGIRVPNGLLGTVGNGATVSYGSQPTDLAAGAGQALAVGNAIGLQSDLDAAWDLGEIWVRNTTGGSNATVILNGPVFREV